MTRSTQQNCENWDSRVAGMHFGSVKTAASPTSIFSSNYPQNGRLGQNLNPFSECCVRGNWLDSRFVRRFERFMKGRNAFFDKSVGSSRKLHGALALYFFARLETGISRNLYTEVWDVVDSASMARQRQNAITGLNSVTSRCK